MRSGTPALKVMTCIKGRPVTRFEPGLTLVRLQPESIGVAGRWHLRGMCVSRRRPPRHRQHAGAVRESPACRGYTSKHGLIGLTRTLAAEWGGRGVRVNAESLTTSRIRIATSGTPPSRTVTGFGIGIYNSQTNRRADLAAATELNYCLSYIYSRDARRRGGPTVDSRGA